ncbi:MAG TPA: Spy/CpxP family protein refolding chaperone [Alphaproteobacteria bacterium]|nr:Spy/CpxP family protein refolding chaperone [Alphaproteobacteria bacterium]
MNLRKIAFVSLAALSLGGAVALAQTTPPPAGGPPHHHEISRAEMCTMHQAHMAGHLAYLEVRLNLTAEQKPLWTKWRDALAPGMEKAHAMCMERAGKPEAPESIVERAAHLQQMLAARAASLAAAQPALTAFYNALTPDQKAILDRPMGRWGHHGGHHWGHHMEGKGHGWQHHPGDEQKKDQ